MTLTINNKDYDLHFGLDFIAYLDKKHYIVEEGYQLGNGLPYVITQIEIGNPLIFLDLITAATRTGAKPKEEDIKTYLETEADIEVLANDFLSAFKKAPTTRFTLKKLGLLEEPKTTKVKR